LVKLTASISLIFRESLFRVCAKLRELAVSPKKNNPFILINFKNLME